MEIVKEDMLDLKVGFALADRKNELWRIRMTFMATVPILLMLITGSLVKPFEIGIIAGWLFSLFCVAILMLPIRLAWRMYFGLEYPYNNHHKHKWVYNKNAVALMVDISGEDYGEKWRRVRKDLDTSKWVMFRSDSGWDGNRRVFMFKSQREAMLFRLMI